MIGLEHHAMCAWSSSRRSALTSPSRPRLPGGSTQLHGWGYAAIVAAAVTADDHIGVGWLILVDMVAGVVGSGTQYAAVAVASLRVIPFVAAGFAALCIVSFALALRLPTVSPRSSGASRGAPKVQ
jgi:hypothetical protein